MKSNKIINLLFSLVFVGSLASCGGQTSNDSDHKTITFMGWTNATEKQAYKQVLKDFEEKYNCTVKYNNVAVGEYRSKLNSMLSADALTNTCTADVFYCPYGMLWDKAIGGHVENLQPYVDKDDKLNLDDIWDLPGFYQYKLTGSEVGKGDIYAFPKDVGPYAMVYNKTLFEEFGLECPSLDNPWNWDDLFTYGKLVNNKIANPDAKRNRWLMAGYNIEQAVWGNDASFLSEDKRTVKVNDEKFIESLEFIRRLTTEKITPNSTEIASLDGYTRWTQGQIGIYWAGPWDVCVYNDELDFEWDYFPLVAGPNGTQATYVGYMGLAMSSRSQEKDLAYELIKYLTTNEECQRKLYEFGQIIPNLKSMAKGEYLEYYNDKKNVYEWINILERTGRPQEYMLTPSDSWFSPFNNSVGTVFNGDTTARDFCNSIQAQMQEELDKSYEELETLKKSVGWTDIEVD